MTRLAGRGRHRARARPSCMTPATRGGARARDRSRGLRPLSRSRAGARPASAATPPTTASSSTARAMRCRSPLRAARSPSCRAAIPACSPWRRRCSRRSRPATRRGATLDIRVEPGVTAMLAAAAEVGAPLGGDFCAISLSDNLKAWSTIERRLKAAAEGDFVIALYNPASKARPTQLGQAFDLLRTLKSADTPVLFVRAAGTADAAGDQRRRSALPIRRAPTCAPW